MIHVCLKSRGKVKEDKKQQHFFCWDYFNYLNRIHLIDGRIFKKDEICVFI